MLSPSTLRSPEVLLATGLGVGFLPRAPGTWGSVAAVLIWWFVLAELPVSQQLVISGCYFLAGWWCSHRIAQRYGVEDAGQIVADEIVGMWVALAFLPQVWWLALLAFIVFRWLDIVKPSLIGWLDREVKGGLGVMLDDLVAGVIAGSSLLVCYTAVQVLLS